MSVFDFTGVTAMDDPECLGSFDYTTSIIVIIIACVLGLGWAAFNFIQVRGIDVGGESATSTGQLVDINEEQRKLLIELGDKIANVLVFSLRVQLNSSSRNISSASSSW